MADAVRDCTRITSFLAILFTSMQSGMGNSVATESVEKNRQDLHKIHSLYILISGWCSITFFALVQPFMVLWVGKDLMFPTGIAAMLAVYFYTMKMTDTVNAYLSATGLWWKCKHTYLIEAVTNITLNILLGKYFGVVGIIVATMISVVFVNYACTLVIVCRNYFGREEIRIFLIKELSYFVISMAIGIITWCFCHFSYYSETGSGIIITLLIRLAFCVIAVPGIYFLILHRNEEVRGAVKWLLPNVKKFVRRKQ